MQPKITATIRLDTKTAEFLKRLAGKRDLSFSKMIETALTEFVETEKQRPT